MERFRDFIKLVTTLSRQEYVEQFPHPLLLFSEQAGALDGLSHTRLVDSAESTSNIDRFSQQLLDFIPLLPNPRPSSGFPQKAFVGRDDRRDFVIRHNTVSQRHACIFFDSEPDAWKLVDSGSTNGTFLRGRRLTPGEPIGLAEADVITFGKVNFMFFSPHGAYRYMSQFRLFRDAMRDDS